MNTRTAGRDDSCDLVLEHPTVSRQHARLELADDGRVFVMDSGSRNGTFLQRNDAWIRISKVSLCVGDTIRFGDLEVPLQQLAAIFGKHADVRLGEKRFSLRHGVNVSGTADGWDDSLPSLQKPRRNPLTGKIEEEDRL